MSVPYIKAIVPKVITSTGQPLTSPIHGLTSKELNFFLFNTVAAETWMNCSSNCKYMDHTMAAFVLKCGQFFVFSTRIQADLRTSRREKTIEVSEGTQLCFQMGHFAAPPSALHISSHTSVLGFFLYIL